VVRRGATRRPTSAGGAACASAKDRLPVARRSRENIPDNRSGPTRKAEPPATTACSLPASSSRTRCWRHDGRSSRGRPALTGSCSAPRRRTERRDRRARAPSHSPLAPRSAIQSAASV
jgi:hypothetical protein